MTQLIKADLYRIFNKKGLYGYAGICSILFAGLIYIISGQVPTPSDYLMLIAVVISFVPLMIGMYTVSIVYNDDLKSKSLQSAIGFGMRRSMLVISKLITSVLVFTVIVLGFFALSLLLPQIFGIALDTITVKAIIALIAAEYVKTIVFFGIISMVAFFTQRPTTVTTVFILLATGTVANLLGLLLGQKFIVSLVGNLQPYLVTALANSVSSAIMTNDIDVLKLVLLAVYLVVSLIAAGQLFNKKELEF